MPNLKRTNICIVTYSSVVNYYTINKENQGEVSIVVAGGIDSDCVPLPLSKLFFNLAKEKDMFLKVLALIKKLNKDSGD